MLDEGGSPAPGTSSFTVWRSAVSIRGNWVDSRVSMNRISRREIPLLPWRPKPGPTSPQLIAIQTTLNLFVKAENHDVPSDLVLKVKPSPYNKTRRPRSGIEVYLY